MTKRKSVGWALFFVIMIVLALQLPRAIGHVYYLAGLKFYSSGHYQAAAAAFECTVFFRPKFARGYIELGSSYLGLGKYGKAEKVFVKASSIQDDSCASCGLGMTYYYLHRYDEAEKTFTKAMSLNPNDTCAYIQSGNMYCDLGRYQEAVTAFKRAVSLQPNKSNYFLLGNAYVWLGQFESGVDAYKQALRLDPHDSSAHRQLGIAFDYLGRFEEAVKEYRQAIDLNPNDEKARYSLVLVYLTMRNQPAAVEQYQILQAINPDMAAELFEKSALLQGREIGKQRLYFVPVGNFSKQDLIELVTYCKRKSGVRPISAPALSLESAAFDTKRHQLIAEEAIAQMKRRYPQLAQDPNAILIGLTEEDMYIRNQTWQFAFSYRKEGRFAVVSSAHMNAANPGQAVNNDLLNIRMRKMVMKNVGLLYYLLPVNDNPKSVLYRDISGVEDLDRMGDDF